MLLAYVRGGELCSSHQHAAQNKLQCTFCGHGGDGSSFETGQGVHWFSDVASGYVHRWLEVHAKSGKNFLYVVIDNEAIKKAEVTAKPRSKNGTTTLTDSAKVSIAKVLEKINSPDVFKYVTFAGDTPLSILAILLQVW